MLTKLILRDENNKLIDQCKKAEELEEEVRRTLGFIARRKKKLEVRRLMSGLKNDFLEHEEVMDCFKKEMNLQNVNPLVYLGYLLAGCMGFVCSFIIVFHT